MRHSLAVLLLFTFTVRADEFDRLEGPALAGVAKSPDARAHQQLTIAELGTLPLVLQGVRAAVLVVKTDQGNSARMIISPALRNPTAGQGQPAAILVVERFDTFEAGATTTRIARGREVILFDTFRYDLDSGQVVPEGQGGDLQFLAQGKGGGTLIATSGATLYTLSQSPLHESALPGKPSAGRVVLPTDFAGRFRLFANGQWSGALELKVADHGVVTGRFQSDETGTSYPVTGQVGPESPQRIHFAITFPRARQELNGHLFTDGKGAMAGTVSLLNQQYGFFALREGGRFALEDKDRGQRNEE